MLAWQSSIRGSPSHACRGQPPEDNNDNGGEHVSDATDAIAIPGTDAALVKRQDGVWTLAMRVRGRRRSATPSPSS